MVYKKFQDEQGDYIDVNRVRFTVIEAHEAITPQGKNVGWNTFNNMSNALTAYGLKYAPLNKGELK